MSRKDLLAAGQRSAKFAGGMGENDIFRNVAPEGSKDDTVPTLEPIKIARDRFYPLENTLLVRRKVVEKHSLLITDTMEKEQPAEGTIVERGPNVTIDIGTRVVYGKYSGTEFKLNGETFLLMQVSDLLGTLATESEVEETEETIEVGGCIVARA